MVKVLVKRYLTARTGRTARRGVALAKDTDMAIVRADWYYVYEWVDWLGRQERSLRQP